jgi:GTP1/Obg family GTP-binding protein
MAGKRYQPPKKKPTSCTNSKTSQNCNDKNNASQQKNKKAQNSYDNSRTVKTLIKQANNPTTSTQTTSTKSTPNYLTKGPVFSPKQLHPPLPSSQITSIPTPHSSSSSTSQTIANPTAAHVISNPTAVAKALQDPILINKGQALILDNNNKPYFKYGLCRTIKHPPNPTEIQQSITKRQEQVQEAKGFNNPKDRIRDHCLRRLQLGVSIFLNRLDSSTNSLPTVLTLLHPFEYELATLTLAQHSHDNPISYNVLKALPQNDIDLLLQHALLQESRVDHSYHEKFDQLKLAQIKQILNDKLCDAQTVQTKITRLKNGKNLESQSGLNEEEDIGTEDIDNDGSEYGDSNDDNIDYAAKRLSQLDLNDVKTQVYHYKTNQDGNIVPYKTPLVDGFSNLRIIGTVYYSTILYNVNKCRELIVHHYYKFKKLLSNHNLIPQQMHEISKQEIKEMTKLLSSQFFTSTMSLFRSLTLLLKTQHWIDPNIPTVLCIGAPNVGKSSLVRALSTSKTPVQSYRFTTRKLTMGHLELPNSNYTCQVTDSPGLLPRSDEKRNAMEALTIAAIKHLPLSSIIFVIDPTAQGGVSVEHQLLLRNEMRWRFGNIVGAKQWCDVVTKGDIWSKDYGVKRNTLPLLDVKMWAQGDSDSDPLSKLLNTVGTGADVVVVEGDGDDFDEQNAQNDHNIIITTPEPTQKKRGRPRKNPLLETQDIINTVNDQDRPKITKKRGITPDWTLPNALSELSHILPPPPGDDRLDIPSFTLSTIHLRDVHNELSNQQLSARFLKNSRAKKQEQEKQQLQSQREEAERHRVGGGMYDPRSSLYEIGDGNDINPAHFEDNFASLSLDQFDSWWDSLPKSTQKVYTQAINDTDQVLNGVANMLEHVVNKVEKKQFVKQMEVVQKQHEEDTMYDQNFGRNKRDDGW